MMRAVYSKFARLAVDFQRVVIEDASDLSGSSGMLRYCLTA
jgi:hypothetical protein